MNNNGVDFEDRMCLGSKTRKKVNIGSVKLAREPRTRSNRGKSVHSGTLLNKILCQGCLCYFGAARHAQVGHDRDREL